MRRPTTSLRPDIIHVSSAHPWVDNRVHLREAASAAAAGYRVHLIAVDTPLEAPKTGVHVIRIPRRPRIRRMTVSTIQAITLAMRSGATVVHLHDPELIWAIPLLRLAGRRVVYDAHEDLPDQVMSKDYLSPRQRRLFRLVAKGLVRLAGTADHVIAATAWTARLYPASKTTPVHNFPLVRVEDAQATPITERSLAVAHIGVLSHDRGIDTVAAVAGSSEFPAGWRVEVAGSIDRATDRSRLDDAILAGSTRHHGILSPTDARDLLLDARIGLVPFRPTPVMVQIFPTKLFEYLAAGLAVIMTDVPLWRELLDGVDCVTFVPADDPDAVAAAIRSYAEDPSLLSLHGAAARDAARSRFLWAREAETLLSVYDQLLPNVRNERQGSR